MWKVFRIKPLKKWRIIIIKTTWVVVINVRRKLVKLIKLIIKSSKYFHFKKHQLNELASIIIGGWEPIKSISKLKLAILI